MESHIFQNLSTYEEIQLDFSEVKVLTPSWAEEFIYGFQDNHDNPLSFVNTSNPSVEASLKAIIEPIDVKKIVR